MIMDELDKLLKEKKDRLNVLESDYNENHPRTLQEHTNLLIKIAKLDIEALLIEIRQLEKLTE